MQTLNNYTISEATFSVEEGSNIYDTQQTATLIISANTGYVVNALDFSRAPGPVPDFIYDYEFIQAGDDVHLILTFENGYLMPSSNLIGEFCIQGSAAPKTYIVKASIEYSNVDNASWDFTDMGFYEEGFYNETVLVQTNTLTANSGTIITNTEVVFDFPNPNFTYTENKTYNLEGEWVSSTFLFYYTFPANDWLDGNGSPLYTSPYYIRVDSTTETPYIALPQVTAYAVSTTSVPSAGGEIIINVYGNPGAIFSIEQTSQGGGVFITTNFELTSNYQSFTYAIPSVTANTDRIFEISGDLNANFNTPNGQYTTFIVRQNLPVSITFDAYGTNISGWTPVVRAYNPYSAPVNGSYNSFANIVWEITGDTNQDLNIIREIELDDWSNLPTVSTTLTSSALNSTNLELADTTGISNGMLLINQTFSYIYVVDVIDSNNITISWPVTYSSGTEIEFSSANNNVVTIDSLTEISGDLKTVTVTSNVDITQYGSDDIVFTLNLDNIIESYTPTACIEFYAAAGPSGGSVIYRDCSNALQSFVLAPNEISQNYFHLQGTIEASADVTIYLV